MDLKHSAKKGSKKKLKAVKLFENEENQRMAVKSSVLKKKKRNSNTDLAEQKDVDVVIGDSLTGIVSANEKVKKVKKGKRKSVSTDNTTLGHANSVTQNVNTSLDSLEKCNMVEDGSAEEEIEIWVPNKKYKGNLLQICNSSPTGSGQSSTGLSDSKKKKPKSAFARFEKLSKTPPAFVRRAVSKLSTPNTDPRKKASKKHKLDIADQTPGSGKRVSFNMKRNKALEFQDSLMFSPEPPFNPQKTPDQGILKTPPASAIYKLKTKTTPKRIKQTAGHTPGPRRSRASDFF